VLEKIKASRLSTFESIGALGFIGVAFFGLIFGGWFFNNFLVRSGIIFNNVHETGYTGADFNTAGVLPLMNFAVGVKVIVGLFVIVLIMGYASSIKEWKQ
jgi:multicomponent Na+:H+ antiporter subunit B